MKIYILGLFTILLLACKNGDKDEILEYSIDGVSINYSSDWILESEDLDGEGYYISIEKKGLDSSGLYQLYWVNGIENPEALLEDQKREFSNEPVFSGIRFSDNYTTYYNKFDAISSEYKVALLEIEGQITAFINNNKGFVIITQQDYDSDSENKEGFDIIEKSFSVSNSFKSNEKKEFYNNNIFNVSESNVVGEFKFKPARSGDLLHFIPSDSSLVVFNNTGHDIIGAYINDLIIEIQVGKETDRVRRKLKFDKEISTDNPWKNGNGRKIISGAYDFRFGFDEYALKNYDILKANLILEMTARNKYENFSFSNVIYERDLTNELILLKKSLK